MLFFVMRVNHDSAELPSIEDEHQWVFAALHVFIMAQAFYICQAKFGKYKLTLRFE